MKIFLEVGGNFSARCEYDEPYSKRAVLKGRMKQPFVSAINVLFALSSAIFLTYRILARHARARTVLFSFGVIADIQYADIDDKKDGRFYRNVLKVCARFMVDLAI